MENKAKTRLQQLRNIDARYLSPEWKLIRLELILALVDPEDEEAPSTWDAIVNKHIDDAFDDPDYHGFTGLELKKFIKAI